MSMEFVNRICPICNNPNFMVLLGDFSKAYKYKCMNCNEYFNDIDFVLQPVWKSECMNTKVDMVEVIRCRNCKHRGKIECPMTKGAEDGTLIDYLDNDWYCADGERKDGDKE